MFRSSPPSGGFTPTSLPNLLVWLDGADVSTITRSGGLISQWADKSGNANHATQATGANQPSYGASQINGLSCPVFAGSPDSLTLTTPIPWANTNLFVVTRMASGATDGVFLGNSGALELWGLSGGLYQIANPGSTFYNGYSPDGNAHLYSATLTGSPNTTYIDGTLFTPVGYTDPNGACSDTIDTIGAYSAGANLDAPLGEVLIYSPPLTSGQVTEILAYLDAKWGLGF
jgi:hypothetical protein